MVTGAFKLPVIPLTLYTDNRDSFSQKVGESLKDTGFFALTEHNLSEADLNRSYKSVKDLFALPTNIKLKYTQEAGQRGYTPFRTEHAKDHATPDLKEFWHVGDPSTPNPWPSELKDFRAVSEELYRKLFFCSKIILRACAKYIGEREEEFAEMIDGGETILRMIHYPAIDTEYPEGSMRAAAHEDINLITLLVAATAEGLQLKLKSGEWVDVVTPPDCIVIDAGDMLQNLTNGLFSSTTHRVVNPADPSIPRYSMPFFVHPRASHSLNPLPRCILKTGGIQQFPNITAGQYLEKRLREIGLLKT